MQIFLINCYMLLNCIAFHKYITYLYLLIKLDFSY